MKWLAHGRANPISPDQLFDEKKFEAHRELGFMTCLQMLRTLKLGTAPEPPKLPVPVPADITTLVWASA